MSKKSKAVLFTERVLQHRHLQQYTYSKSYACDRIGIQTGAALNDARKREGLTKQELATLAGRDKPWVKRILKGEENLNLVILAEIAYEMNCEVEVIVRSKYIEDPERVGESYADEPFISYLLTKK